MKRIWMAGAVAGGVLVMSATALAQGTASGPTGSTSPRAQAEAREAVIEVHTFFLKDRSERETRDLLTYMRNLMPRSLAYLINVGGQYAITVKANATDLDWAQKMITELDKAQKQYRVTYTLIEMDGEKPVGRQAYTVVGLSGEQTQAHEGSKASIAIAPGNPASQFLDVGISIEAKVETYGDQVKLQTKLERSSLAAAPAEAAQTDPVMRQTNLMGTAVLMLGKPVVLGSLDIPGSTRHQEVEVEVEAMP
jgi:hypothetical protein